MQTKTKDLPAEYVFYTEFQSHEPEFDYLKSLEIEERINKVRWLKRMNANRFLLSTNGVCFVLCTAELKQSFAGCCARVTPWR